MAGFGGAVKLTGESEYRKALDQITRNLKEVASEMKAVSSSYAANDKSTEAVAAKTAVLNKQLTEQTSKLNTLKSQYASMTAQYNEQAQKHQQLVNSYTAEKAKLDELGRTVGTTSKEYQDQKGKVESLANEVKKSTNAQDANEKSMSNMRVQINNAQADINKTTRELDKLGDAAEESGKDAQKAGDGFTVFKGILANLGTQAINSAINGLKSLGGAFVNTGKQALDSFAQYEQLEGGVKKIFGDDLAQEVMANADKAFKTAGMSANEYMDTVTGFSATLLQGLGDDTSKAAQYADTAIRNMSDNANTFGTDMASIQHAYQGFAKGNFTMLDNLKLGYGGTQAEMARLINESGVLGDAMEVTAETVKDVPFYQMIQAIDETQKRMGIMGTTAKEASGTIEGSTGSMKSAWQNMLRGMADENANFEQLASDFVGTLITEDGKGGALGTIIPRVATVVTGISNTIATLLPQLVQQVVPLIQENLPIIISAVEQALQTILGVLPQVIPVITQLIPQIVVALTGLLPDLVHAGIELLLSLMGGIEQTIPQLLEMIPDIITDIVEVLSEWMTDIVYAGIDLLMALIDGIIKTIPKLIDAMPRIISAIVDTLLYNLPLIIQAGVALLTALVENMPAIINGIVNALPTLITGLIKGLMNNLPAIINAGVQLFVALVQNMPKIISGIVNALPQIISAIIEGIVGAVPDIAEAGLDLIKGLWQGIKDAKDWIMGKIQGFMDGIVKGIKKFFGIKSPSKLFKDEIGENLALGIGEGFSDEMKNVTTDMKKAIPTSFDVEPNIKSISGTGNARESYEQMLSAFKDALSQVTVQLDDEVAGSFVKKTVTREVYSRTVMNPQYVRI